MREWLQDIGIDGPNMLAGFSGGVVRVFFDRTAKPVDIKRNCVVAQSVEALKRLMDAQVSHFGVASTGKWRPGSLTWDRSDPSRLRRS